MGIHKAGFSVERRSFLPILRIIGMTKAIPGVEQVLLAIAIKYIDIVEKSNGNLMEIDEKMVDIPKEMAAVRFHVIFKNEIDLEKAILELQEELGWYPNSFFSLDIYFILKMIYYYINIR